MTDLTPTSNLVGWPLPGPWVADAACHNDDPDDWFPDPGVAGHPAQRHALKVCRACPVQNACLDYALDHEHPLHVWGVWGGTTARQRRQLHQDRADGKVIIVSRSNKARSQPLARMGNRPVLAAEVREWAAEHGLPCSSRGAIRRDVIEAWKAAHPEAVSA